jgi:6-phosphofructokinase 1
MVGGAQIYLEDQHRPPSAMRRLGGICNYVAEDIAEACGAETRATVLGHLQRGGSPTPFDRVLGTRFGAVAVHLVARGGFGRMVALRGTDIVDVSIGEAIARQKLVDPAGELVQAARSVGISFGA